MNSVDHFYMIFWLRLIQSYSIVWAPSAKAVKIDTNPSRFLCL